MMIHDDVDYGSDGHRDRTDFQDEEEDKNCRDEDDEANLRS